MSAAAESAAASRSGPSWPPPASPSTFIHLRQPSHHQAGCSRLCASRGRRPAAESRKSTCGFSALPASVRCRRVMIEGVLAAALHGVLSGGQIRSQHGSVTHLRFRQAGARRRSGMSAQNSKAPWPTSAKSHLIGYGSVASAMGHAIRIADLQMSIHGNWAAQRPPSRSCRADTSTASNRYLTAASDATWGS